MSDASRGSRALVEAALAAAVDALSDSQGWRFWPGAEMAAIAYRRWHSFARRKRSRRPTTEMRINDLVTGLQSHFEPDIPYTHPSDWRALARVLARVLVEYETKIAGDSTSP